MREFIAICLKVVSTGESMTLPLKNSQCHQIRNAFYKWRKDHVTTDSPLYQLSIPNPKGDSLTINPKLFIPSLDVEDMYLSAADNLLTSLEEKEVTSVPDANQELSDVIRGLEND